MNVKVLAVYEISETHSMIRVRLADGVYWTKVSHAEGERVARQIAAQLREPVGDDESPVGPPGVNVGAGRHPDKSRPGSHLDCLDLTRP